MSIPHAKPKWPEVWWVILIALGLLALNLATYKLQPVVGDDDVLLSDAGVNLALGHGFTSTAWPAQGPDELYAGNAPLYPLLLAPWVKMFGPSLLALRSFACLCGSLAAVILWWALRRLGWIESMPGRLSFIVLGFLTWPVAWASRQNRYDILQVLLCSLLLLAYSWRGPRRWRLLVLFVGGALIALAGFQLAIYLVFVSGIFVLWRRREALLDSIVTCSGVFSGVGGVLLWYIHNGVFHGFLGTIEWAHRLDGGTPAEKWLTHRTRLISESLRDAGMMPLLLIVLIIATASVPRKTRILGVIAFAITAAIAVGMEAVVHFANYYRWMTLLPLAGISVVMLERSWSLLGRCRRAAIVIVAVVALLVGLPRWFAYSSLAETARQYDDLDALIARNLRSDDVLFAEYPAYTFVKTKGAFAFYPGYLYRITPEERNSIQVLLVRAHPHNFVPGTPYFGYRAWFESDGSHWTEIARVSPPTNWLSRWLKAHAPDFARRHEMVNLYELALLRRAP